MFHITFPQQIFFKRGKRLASADPYKYVLFLLYAVGTTVCEKGTARKASTTGEESSGLIQQLTIEIPKIWQIK